MAVLRMFEIGSTVRRGERHSGRLSGDRCWASTSAS